MMAVDGCLSLRREARDSREMRGRVLMLNSVDEDMILVKWEAKVMSRGQVDGVKLFIRSPRSFALVGPFDRNSTKC